MIRVPGINNVDLAVFRNFQVSERLKFQLRGEAFNSMNHPQYHSPNLNFGTAALGKITGANDPREFQLAGKLIW